MENKEGKYDSYSHESDPHSYEYNPYLCMATKEGVKIVKACDKSGDSNLTTF